MLVQHWSLQVRDSAWLRKLRIWIALGLACCAGWIVAFVLGAVGVGGWWGDWLWPWPIILYLSWAVAYLPAPLLSAKQTLTLTETGELGDQHIRHSLRTPWLIAIQLSSLPTTGRRDARISVHRFHWVWVLRDQVTQQSWTRLNRVCQNASNSVERAA